jgi:eukaryotic-like serine/threonine-protein kinase
MASFIDLKSGTPNWTALQNTAVDDAFRLQSFLGADANSASYSAKPLHEPGLNAVIRLYVTPDGETAEKQVALWQQAKAFDHPNLIRVLGAGHVTEDPDSLIYVALEPADERLEGVLRERPLDAAEAEEILKSLAAALGYCHERGLVHGVLSTEQVFAVGEQIKISTENLHPMDTDALVFTSARYLAPESTESNRMIASDIWCLGATLYESLTQMAPDEAKTKLHGFPEPLKTVIGKALDPDPRMRPALSDIEGLVKGNTAPPEPEKTVATTLEFPAPVAQPESSQPETELFNAPEPPKTRVEPIVMPQARTPEPPKTLYPVKNSALPIPLWAYGLGLVVILLALIWLFSPKSSPASKQNSAPAAKPVPAAQQKVITPSGEVHPPAGNSAATPAPEIMPKKSPGVRATGKAAKTSSPSAAPQTQTSAQSNSASPNGNVWRVIVYTYLRREDAQRKADEINEQHSKLKAEVFAPKGDSSPYLITVGGSMDRDAAKQFRQTAVQSGLPRDSYIQNFNH